MSPEITVVCLRGAGVVMLLLVPLNVISVPRRLNWKQDMAGLTVVNRQIFRVHAAFICLILALFGLLSLLMARQLMEPLPLARAVSGGLTLFWTARLATQWFVYSPTIWRGHRFYTVMHYAFTAIWIYLAATFFLAWLKAMQFV